MSWDTGFLVINALVVPAWAWMMFLGLMLLLVGSFVTWNLLDDVSLIV